jgi:hypothetical protein
MIGRIAAALELAALTQITKNEFMIRGGASIAAAPIDVG